MAHVEFSGKDTFPKFYNVDGPVGGDLNVAYRRDDVMLVQWLLKKVWAHREELMPAFPPPPSPGEIAVDGIFGPITRRWIYRYQEVEQEHGECIWTDGRVDPSRGTGMSEITGTWYTIRYLNKRARQAARSEYDDPEGDPECPEELKAALMAPVAVP